jgi:hypothetical protein
LIASRAGELDRLARDDDLAAVRLDSAGDILPSVDCRAVLADERVDLAGRDRDADIGERPSSVVLADPRTSTCKRDRRRPRRTAAGCRCYHSDGISRGWLS